MFLIPMDIHLFKNNIVQINLNSDLMLNLIPKYPEIIKNKFTPHAQTAYNSVINIFASVFIFLYFSKLKIRSGLINAVASASLGCYLLNIFVGLTQTGIKTISQISGNVINGNYN